MLHRGTQRGIAWQELAGKRQGGRCIEQHARALIDAHDHAALVDRQDALLEGLEHRSHQLVVGLERLETGGQLFRHAMHGRREVAHLAGRG